MPCNGGSLEAYLAYQHTKKLADEECRHVLGDCQENLILAGVDMEIVEDFSQTGLHHESVELVPLDGIRSLSRLDGALELTKRPHFRLQCVHAHMDITRLSHAAYCGKEALWQGWTVR